MVKTITKIRPYRVFKQNGLYYVRINNKKLYINHHHKKNNKQGDKHINKQIVKVVVNNLMAERKSRRKKRKQKDVIGIQKGPPGLQPPNGKVNVYKIDDSKTAEQAPTFDPLYTNANKRTQQLLIEDGAPPAILKDVDMLKQQNEEYGMRFILGSGYDLDNDGIEEEEDKSDEQDQAQAPREPEVQEHGAQAPVQAPAEVPAEEPAEVPAEEPAEEQAVAPAVPAAAPGAEVEAAEEPEAGEQGAAGEQAEAEVEEAAPEEVEGEIEQKQREPVITRSKTKPLNVRNLIKNMETVMLQNPNYGPYRKDKLIFLIQNLDPGLNKTTITKTYKDVGQRMNKYAELLIGYPRTIPADIEPRLDIKEIKQKLLNTTILNLKAIVLPKFVTSKSEQDEIRKITNKAKLVGRIFNIIYDHPQRAENMEGWGTTNATIKKEGMTSDEIQAVLKKKLHHVIPVIPSNGISDLLPLVNSKTQHFGFVINSQSDLKGGLHWRAIYIDRKKAEVCFFDSLVSEPTESVLRGIKQLIHKMDDSLYYKLKINRIKLQSDNTSTCGAFALRFIADMYEGKTFKNATHFTDEHINGEKIIRKYISKWGYI